MADEAGQLRNVAQPWNGRAWSSRRCIGFHGTQPDMILAVLDTFLDCHEITTLQLVS